MDEIKNIPVLVCTSCQNATLPPQYICRQCGNAHFTQTSIPGRGRLYTYTVIRVASPAFQNQTPYHVLVVELKSGLRVSARLAANGDTRIEIGQEMVLDRIDESVYWFHPFSA
ncbi:MAG: OB-fold domain-containing protein [Desulfatirhabdiaceae bacterium]